MFNDVEAWGWHIKYLAPFQYARQFQRQRRLAAVALLGQRMEHCFGRLGHPLERVALVPDLAADALARRLAQGARLLCKAVRRGRHARIMAILIHLRFQRIQASQQRQNEDILLAVR